MSSNSTICDITFPSIYILSGGLGIIICSYPLLKLIIKYCCLLNSENDNINELDESQPPIQESENKNKKEKIIEENDIDDEYNLPSYNELYSSEKNH
tara:strand:+ start:148 stop:438 length:291 start_codon:yes stop_codon:yes gene_type:complete